MNKMFTSVAIMQLMEQGKLSLDDKVGKYLPDIPHPEIAEKVTIYQLLTHTSGMQDYWDEIFAKPFWEIKTVAQMGELILMTAFCSNRAQIFITAIPARFCWGC